MAKNRPTARLGSPYADPPAATAVVPRWATRERVMWLWHGTAEPVLTSLRRGLDLRYCQRQTDFGRGFYTTTYRDQAREWAEKITRATQRRERNRTIRGVIIGFPVPVDALPPLYSLPFVRPEPNNDLFWSFVRHCRGLSKSDPTDPSHYPDAPEQTHLCQHPSGGTCYDMVCGPVTMAWGRWPQVFLSYDQYSFHTPAAVAVLNALLPSARVVTFRVR